MNSLKIQTIVSEERKIHYESIFEFLERKGDNFKRRLNMHNKFSERKGNAKITDKKRDRI